MINKERSTRSNGNVILLKTILLIKYESQKLPFPLQLLLQNFQNHLKMQRRVSEEKEKFGEFLSEIPDTITNASSCI